MIFDPIRKTVNLGKRRVTDLKENTRVNLPKALSPSDEAKLDVRLEGYREVFQEYKQEACKNPVKGKQMINLTRSEEK